MTPGQSYRWWLGDVGSTGNVTWTGPTYFTIAPLAAPALTAPGGTVATDVPTFSWTSVADADHYWLWVQDQTTHRVAVNIPNLTATSWTPAQPLALDDNYTWWVAAVSTNGLAIDWSSGLNFRIAPSGSGPGGTSATDVPTFAWNSVTGADHYYLYVRDQTTGQVPVNNNNVSGTSWTPTQPLTLGDNYVWYVGAVSGQTVAWDSGLTFHIAPVASGPSGTIATDLPAFSWDSVTGADHYYLYVSDQTTSQILVNNNNVTGTAWTPAQPLRLGDNYIWYVGAVSGQTIGWDSRQTFTIAPTALAPAGNIATDQPTFTWSAVTGAAGYDLYVVDQNTRQVLYLTNLTATTLTLGAGQALTPGHGFTWYAAAVSTNGQQIAWSGPQTFTIAALTAPAPLLPSGTITATQPTLSWAAVTDTARYDVWVDDTTAGQSQVVRTKVTGTSLVPAKPLTAGHSYTWWVAAVSTNGLVSVWNGGAKFTIVA